MIYCKQRFRFRNKINGGIRERIRSRRHTPYVMFEAKRFSSSSAQVADIVSRYTRDKLNCLVNFLATEVENTSPGEARTCRPHFIIECNKFKDVKLEVGDAANNCAIKLMAIHTNQP